MAKNTLTYEEVAMVQRAARAHKGGRLAGHYRMLRRNTYTVDPTRPAPDALDLERDRLREQAAEMARAYARQEADRFGTCEGSELHRLEAYSGWLI